jgi:hypothetical protein
MIPVFRKMKQEDHEFEDSLGYTDRYCLKQQQWEMLLIYT